MGTSWRGCRCKRVYYHTESCIFLDLTLPLASSFGGRYPTRDSTRHPPYDTFIKINFDTAILDADWFQIVAVGRDIARQWVGLFVRKFRGSPSPVVAEAYAARLALQLAKTKGWTKVHLKGDCLCL